MLGGLCISLAATSADAAEARYRLAIEPSSYADALIALGFQADVSVLGTAACGAGGQVALRGVFTLPQALRRVTREAPCSFRIVDPRTVRISAVVPRPAAAPARPAAVVAEVLVTATKRPAGVNRLPASISVISREQIALTGAADVGEAADQVSGVFTTNLGPGRDKVILRGLSDGAFTGHARSTVGSYLDDTPVNYNAPDPDLRLADVERIEVVRGPQGALYGSGSLSGVYRIVTRKPDLGRYDAGGAGALAWTYGGSPSQEAEGFVNLPVIADRAAVRLVGYYDLQGGYIDNVSLNLPNIDRTTRAGGRAAARLQASETWQLDLMAAGQRLRSNDSHYTTSASDRDLRLGQVREAHKNDFDDLSLTLRGELGWASLRSSAGLVDHTFSSQYDATAALAIFAADPGSVGVYREKTRISMLVEDTVLRSSRPGPLTWLVGLYAAATLEKSPSTLDIRAPAGGLARAYDEHRRDRVRETAAYGEAAYEFRPLWTLSLGARAFATDVRTRALVLVAPPGTSRTFEGTRRFSGLSPKLSLQRELGGGGLVYALFSQGYRPGGFNTGGFLFPIRASRVSFAPDQLRNYEVGLKQAFLDDRLLLHAAVFYDRWSDIQSDQYRPSGLPFTVNVGDARITGLEAEVGYAWGFGLSVQASALALHARLADPNLDFADQLSAGLPSVPNLSGGLLVSYEHPLPRNLTLRLTAEASYEGRSTLSFDAAQAPAMSQYGKAKLTAQLAGPNWTAMLFVTNPGNDAGNTFAYGNPFTFGQVRQSTPQRPRTVGLRLAANY
ncbi:MAG TPA: TonB-dependent receptor [Phenylobacterium sp.]|uniref:TonB-dependent receptor n=1 Tax=Phenylobacterium sp. TaxID=1871053 RepID=UPI002BF49E50|nr:TonB-dependent receptor [Phenylobacterium sp.]HSV02321.1 TonB-dependent receptor [Phenylobacterium sp.]